MTALSPRTFLGDGSRVMVVAYAADAGSGYRFMVPWHSMQLVQQTQVAGQKKICNCWGTWASQLVKCLPLAQVIISGSWDGAPLRA